MEQLLSAVGVGAVVFASTNVDDILLLSAFFSDPGFHRRHVVTGQFLGIGVLVVASAVCSLLALAVPPGWIGLLGLAPLVLGLRGLWRLRPSTKTDAPESDEARALSSGSRALAVAGVTIANGGDNLGVYIPLFSRDLRLVPLYAAVFAVMTAVWCTAGYYFVHNRLVGERIGRYGRLALPFVLIGLGLWILSGSRVLLAGW